MPSVTYNGSQIASSEKAAFIEGNYYFPPDSITEGFLIPSNTQYTCPWKGAATYYSGQINGKTLNDVAWSYDTPKPAAAHIKGFVAFDKSQIKLTA